MASVSFYTLGCKVNIYESENLAGELQQNGYTVETWPGPADVYVINGCAVTARAAAKTRQVAHRIRRTQPQAKLVLIGCYNAAEPEEARAIGADLILDNFQKPRLRRYLDRLMEGDADVLPLERDLGFGEYAGGAPLEHTRPLVKIQDGCDYRCSYCIIPDLRGSERSRSLEAVVKEVEGYRDLGYKELIMTGIHLSRWGQDQQPRRKLSELLSALLELDDLPRLRLSSAEPTDIDDDLIALYASGDKRLCPHLHIPLQSGCDATLRRMGRRYSCEDYRQLLTKLRQRIPQVSISTDLIVGFPGEDEAEFSSTLAFCAEMAFSRMHIFRYSSRKGTPAAMMPDKVVKSVQEERSRRMHELAERMAADYAQRFLGHSVDVLLERCEGASGSAKGYCAEYLQCSLPWTEAIPATGLLVPMIVEEVRDDLLIGRPLDR